MFHSSYNCEEIMEKKKKSVVCFKLALFILEKNKRLIQRYI